MAVAEHGGINGHAASVCREHEFRLRRNGGRCRTHIDHTNYLRGNFTFAHYREHHLADAGLLRRDRKIEHFSFALAQFNRVRQTVEAYQIVGCSGQFVGPRLAVGIVDFDNRVRHILWCEHFGQARRYNDRVANDHIAIRLPDARLRPRNRHDARCSVELRDIEIDDRLALGVEAHNARIEREQFFGRRAALGSQARPVATGANAPECTLRGIDQPAVNVADFEPESALAEIPVAGIGRIVIGQVENADIDGGDRDKGFFASLEATDGDRNGELVVRPDLIWQVERH